MAGASTWNGAIRFGPMLQFPVKAKAAVRPTTFAFNMHHGQEGCFARLHQGAYVCDNGHDVPREEVVKGFNGIAPIDEAYLDSLGYEKNPVMELDGWVPAEQIDPRYYQKSYDVIADKGGERAYVLFLKLLTEAKRVAIGKVVMGGKEYIVTIRPRDGILAMEVMYWPDEIKSNADAKASIASVEVSAAELKMGREMVKFLHKDFDPGAYQNLLALATADYLEAIQAGQAPVPITPKSSAVPMAGSLEDMLKASVAAMKPEKPAKRQRKSAAA